DLESSAGTLLNGARVDGAPLHRGDRIRAGVSTFVVDGETLPEPAPASADVAMPVDETPLLTPKGSSAEEPGLGVYRLAHDASLSVATVLSEHPTQGARLSVIVKATFVW